MTKGSSLTQVSCSFQQYSADLMLNIDYFTNIYHADHHFIALSLHPVLLSKEIYHKKTNDGLKT